MNNLVQVASLEFLTSVLNTYVVLYQQLLAPGQGDMAIIHLVAVLAGQYALSFMQSPACSLIQCSVMRAIFSSAIIFFLIMTAGGWVVLIFFLTAKVTEQDVFLFTMASSAAESMCMVQDVAISCQCIQSTAILVPTSSAWKSEPSLSSLHDFNVDF